MTIEPTAGVVEATPRVRRTLRPTETTAALSDATSHAAPAVVNDNANLRAGPGADYDLAGRDETVVIQNNGAEKADLSGWSIQSYGGSTCQPVPEQVFTFPAGYLLAAGVSVRVHGGPGASSNSPVDLLWTRENMWANDGDRADLRNTSGQVVSTWGYDRCR